MELKKLDFTKPLETASGLPVRVICTDKKGLYPLVFLVDNRKGDEYLFSCDEYGRVSSTGTQPFIRNVTYIEKTVYRNVYSSFVIGHRHDSLQACKESQEGDKSLPILKLEFYSDGRITSEILPAEDE